MKSIVKLIVQHAHFLVRLFLFDGFSRVLTYLTQMFSKVAISQEQHRKGNRAYERAVEVTEPSFLSIEQLSNSSVQVVHKYSSDLVLPDFIETFSLQTYLNFPPNKYKMIFTMDE